MVTILGAGLLVGTALAVIIPEGVHALYDQQIHGTFVSKHNLPNYFNLQIRR